MRQALTLLRVLADGAMHEEGALMHSLGLTATALARALAALGEQGLELDSPRPHTVRLPRPLDLIDRTQLEMLVAPEHRARLEAIELLDEVDSTNARLLATRGPEPGRWRACLAEFQSAGRGRRGRAWQAPPASGVCLSFGWTFAEPPAALSAISLAAGVACLRALARHDAAGLSLKWPNDVLKDGCKLGGILGEVQGNADGSVHVVIGVGLNVRLPAGARVAVIASGGLEPTDLLARGSAPGRTPLHASLLDALVAMVLEFEAHGLAPFLAEWNRADALKDRPVRVLEPNAGREGVARGIDADGALRFERAGRIERLTAGDVSLRAVA